MIAFSIFPGESHEVALVIAGVHGSELSGIEVAHWLRVKLQARLDKQQKRPHFTTIIIPSLFPESAELARLCRDTPSTKRDKTPKFAHEHHYEWASKSNLNTLCRWSQGENADESNSGREIVLERQGGIFVVPPNRQFPPPGQPLSYMEERGGPVYPDPAGKKRIMLERKEGGGTKAIEAPILERTRELLQLIELVKPVRIASVQGNTVGGKPEKGTDAAGIFVDPRYAYDVKTCPENPVDPTKPDPFGTNPCKFDLVRDPAFPIEGLFQMLNKLIALKDSISSLSHQDDPKVQLAKQHREEARKDVTQALEAQALEQLKQAFSDLGFDFNKDYLQKKVAISAPNSLGRDKDDKLALAIAQNIAKQMPNSNLLPGNHLNDTPEVVHCPASATPPEGFSLGDWGPVTVGKPGDAGNRPGAPVITVEVFDNDESGAFAEDGRQLFDEKGTLIADKTKHLDDRHLTRSKELQAYAEALMEIFLDRP